MTKVRAGWTPTMEQRADLVRREAVPPDSEALGTLIEKYRAHRSQAGDA